MAATGKSRDRAAIRRANLTALDREIRAALGIAQGRGVVAVNVMRAVSQYPDYVRQACESGAQAIVAGAGPAARPPRACRRLARVALVPILSDSRGVAIVLKKWLRKNRLPDAIVIEHPRHAGGHLGAAKPRRSTIRNSSSRACSRKSSRCSASSRSSPAASRSSPRAASPPPTRRARCSISAPRQVQLGTAFAVTEEGDAHPDFKRVLARARPEDIVVFMSVAGLPARAVRTPWLERYLERLPRLQAHAVKKKECTLAWDCLEVCGLRDGKREMGQFCIDQRLAFALSGDVNRGLFFRGAWTDCPFGAAIRPVRELIELVLGRRRWPSPRRPSEGYTSSGSGRIRTARPCSAPTALRRRHRSRGPSRSPRRGRRRRRAGAADSTPGPRRSRGARGGGKNGEHGRAP
jgi:nitronate monooxygenase